MDEKKKSPSMDSVPQILSVNNLKYGLQTNLNVVNSRTQKYNFADNSSYTSGSSSEMVFNIQASTDYVYGPNCELRFDVKLNLETKGDATFGFVNSTAVNLFNRIYIESKNGSELDRIDNVNEYVRNRIPFDCPPDYYGFVSSGELVNGAVALPFNVGVAEMAGRYPLNRPDTGNAPTPISTRFDCNLSKLRVSIPLWWMSELFREETLIPNILISGMKIRLQLESFFRAIRQTSQIGTSVIGASPSYTITDPVIITDSYNLAPMIQRKLMEQSQVGLDYVYISHFYQTSNPGTSTEIVHEVNKSVARAKDLTIITQKSDLGATVLLDSLGTSQYNYYRLQSRVGDIYLPQQEIRAGSSDTMANVQKNASEIYANNLMSLRKMGQCWYPPAVSYDAFRAGGTLVAGASTNNDGNATLIQSYELSNPLEFTGLSVNSSRTLESRITYSSQANGAKIIKSWLGYVRLAKVFPLRTVVKS